MSNVGKKISFRLAAGRTFHIHDAVDARINFGKVMRAAGLEQTELKSVIAKRPHERRGNSVLQIGSAAGRIRQGEDNCVMGNIIMRFEMFQATVYTSARISAGAFLLFAFCG